MELNESVVNYKNAIKQIYKNYSETLTQLTKKIQSHISDKKEIAELDGVRRKMRLVSAQEKFNKSYPHLWDWRTFIIKKDEEYFMNNFESNNNPLIEILRDNFIDLSAVDKDTFWSLLNTLLTHIIEYKKIEKIINQHKSKQ